MLNFIRHCKLATAGTLSTALFFTLIGPANADHRQVRHLDSRHGHYEQHDNNYYWNKRNWHDRNHYKSPRSFVKPLSRFSYYSSGLGNYGSYQWPHTYKYWGSTRPYGHRHSKFNFRFSDHNTMKILGLTALGLVIFNELSEFQRRAHEEALARVSTARIGNQIIWNQNDRSGKITVTRKGLTADGRPCREYQQEIVIGGNREQAYGIACMQPNGAWKLVNK